MEQLSKNEDDLKQENVDSPIKILEITAQQIVDRIVHTGSGDLTDSLQGPSSPNTTKINSVADVSKVPIDEKLEDNSNATNISDASSTTNSPRNTTIVEDKESSSSSESSRIIEKSSTIVLPNAERKTQYLLTLLHKWLKELDEKDPKKLQIEQTGANKLFYLYSIEAFVRSLSLSSQDILSRKFVLHLLKWLKQLFHFRDEKEVDYNGVLPHWEQKDGMVAITKWHLYTSFPTITNEGYEVFQLESQYPVIYGCDEEFGDYITSSLGLVKDIFRVLDTVGTDWLKRFEQLILSDKNVHRVPIVILLNVGKVSESVEDVCKLAESYNIPVHIYGRNTFAYFVKRPENEQIGRSFTLDLKPWINSPPLPFLTIFKKPQNSCIKNLQLVGLSSLNKNLMALAPWFCVEAAGIGAIKDNVEEVCQRGSFLLSVLQRHQFLSIIPNWSTLSHGQKIVSLLAFRFTPLMPVNITIDEDTNSSTSNPSSEYISVLNSWLFHILERDMKDLLQAQFVEIGSEWHILIDIFKTDKFSSEDEDYIAKMFEHHMHVLLSTVGKKEEFARLVEQSSELEKVNYEATWAGLGAVRYIPKFYREGGNQSNEAVKPPLVPNNQDPEMHRKSNINSLNAQIVEKLKSIDNAFSLGVYGDSDWCVQFGMVTQQTEVEELLSLVISTGEEIEESSEFFHQMSELVKKGIEKATEELRKESEDALWEEGILRRVPVFGTFVNWLSPLSREAGIRGRALNLVQGKVESTENIYKYHMQVETTSSPSSSAALLNKFSTPKSLPSK